MGYRNYRIHMRLDDGRTWVNRAATRRLAELAVEQAREILARLHNGPRIVETLIQEDR